MNIIVVITRQKVDVSLGVESFFKCFDDEIRPTESENPFLECSPFSAKIFNTAIDNGRKVHIDTLGGTKLNGFSQRQSKNSSNVVSSLGRGVVIVGWRVVVALGLRGQVG